MPARSPDAQVYITRGNVAPAVGWETGRDSEPAFLDMNRHALRHGGEPPVVLYQFDKSDPLNPLGLLMAYAEKAVTPVVSDFDTFLVRPVTWLDVAWLDRSWWSCHGNPQVGSKGVAYDATPKEQVELMKWALGHTEELLKDPNTKVSSPTHHPPPTTSPPTTTPSHHTSPPVTPPLS
jgi:hypothetical protein